jgi:hypothetical protein
MLTGLKEDPLINSLRDFEKTHPNFYGLEFPGAVTREGAHALLQYPAMMVPELQGIVLQSAALSRGAACSVLDPFVGSGTVLTEAMQQGLDFYGVDINPLAGLACLTKSGPYFPASFEAKKERIVRGIETDRKHYSPRNFLGRDKWFDIEDSRNLESICCHITSEPSKWARRLFWLALSKTIRSVSKSRKSTYKLHKEAISSRQTHKNPVSHFISTLNNFSANLNLQFEKFRASNVKFTGRYLGKVKIEIGNSVSYFKERDIPKNGFDIVMTSPPYGDNQTTIPYGQFSYLQLQWIELADIDISMDPTITKNAYGIDTASLGGSLKGAEAKSRLLAEKYPIAKEFLEKIGENQNAKKRFASFFFDFDKSVEEISAVTANNGIHAWTVANRRIAGHNVPMVELLEEMLARNHITTIGRISRSIKFKKMAPKNKQSATMEKETILLARK